MQVKCHPITRDRYHRSSTLHARSNHTWRRDPEDQLVYYEAWRPEILESTR
jgi:hypothetical protein